MKPYYLTLQEKQFIDSNKDKRPMEIARILGRKQPQIWNHYHGFVKVKPNVKKNVRLRIKEEPKNIDELLRELSKAYAY